MSESRALEKWSEGSGGPRSEVGVAGRVPFAVPRARGGRVGAPFGRGGKGPWFGRRASRPGRAGEGMDSSSSFGLCTPGGSLTHRRSASCIRVRSPPSLRVGLGAAASWSRSSGPPLGTADVQGAAAETSRRRRVSAFPESRPHSPLAGASSLRPRALDPPPPHTPSRPPLWFHTPAGPSSPGRRSEEATPKKKKKGLPQRTSPNRQSGSRGLSPGPPSPQRRRPLSDSPRRRDG